MSENSPSKHPFTSSNLLDQDASLPIRHVIWDWNGTLLDDVPLALGVMNDLLTAHAYAALTREHYEKIFDFPVSDYYIAAGFDLERHAFADLSDRFCTTFEAGLDDAALFHDTRGCLSRLSTHSHFVLSNTEQKALERMLSKFELDHHFEAICGLDTNHATGKIGAGKTLLDRLALNPQQTVMVGDTTHDADVADALGITCILVCQGHNARDRLEATGHPVARSLTEVCDILGVSTL